MAWNSNACRRVIKGGFTPRLFSRTFTVAVRAGMRLNQLRFVRGNPVSSDNRIRRLDEEEQLIYMDEVSPVKASVDRGLRITVNLEGSSPERSLPTRRESTLLRSNWSGSIITRPRNSGKLAGTAAIRFDP